MIAGALNIDILMINGDTSIIDIGFDSLAAVDAQSRIEFDLDIHISVTDFFEKERIKDIVEFLIYHLQKQSNPEEDRKIIREETNSRADTIWEEGEI
jgi:acyl carrier protein